MAFSLTELTLTALLLREASCREYSSERLEKPQRDQKDQQQMRADPERNDAPGDIEFQPLRLEENEPDENDVKQRNAEGDKHIL